MSGTCNFLPTSSVNPENYYMAMRVYVPSVVVAISYFTIWKKIKKSSESLSTSRWVPWHTTTDLLIRVRRTFLTSSTETQHRLSQRDRKMSRMISYLCIGYLVFSLPAPVVRLADPTYEWPLLHVVYYLIYYIQFSVNFTIFAVSNGHYRKAYAFFFWEVICYPWRRGRPVSPSYASSTYGGGGALTGVTGSWRKRRTIISRSKSCSALDRRRRRPELAISAIELDALSTIQRPNTTGEYARRKCATLDSTRRTAISTFC